MIPTSFCRDKDRASNLVVQMLGPARQAYVARLRGIVMIAKIVAWLQTASSNMAQLVMPMQFQVDQVHHQWLGLKLEIFHTAEQVYTTAK
jgi:hypothetical protein